MLDDGWFAGRRSDQAGLGDWWVDEDVWPRRRYQVSDVTPDSRRPRRSGLWEARIPSVQVSGAALAEIGLAIAPQRTLTAAVVLIEAL